jgi:hypothetical protein
VGLPGVDLVLDRRKIDIGDVVVVGGVNDDVDIDDVGERSDEASSDGRTRSASVTAGG